MIGWWIGNAVGFVVIIPVLLTLAVKIVKQLAETGRYAGDIVEHGGRIAANLEPVAEIEVTQRLAGLARTAAVRYADALEPSIRAKT